MQKLENFEEILIKGPLYMGGGVARKTKVYPSDLGDTSLDITHVLHINIKFKTMCIDNISFDPYSSRNSKSLNVLFYKTQCTTKP